MDVMRLPDGVRLTDFRRQRRLQYLLGLVFFALVEGVHRQELVG